MTVDGTSFAVLYVLPFFPVANGTLFAQKKLRFMVKVMAVSYLSPIGLPRVLE